jgi:hypothetical protein
LRKSDFNRGDEDRGAPTFIENNRGEDVVEYRLLLKKSLVFPYNVVNVGSRERGCISGPLSGEPFG